MIRIWTPAEREDHAERFLLRGLAEHVGGGERTAFRNVGELLAFLEASLERESSGLPAARTTKGVEEP